MHICQQLKTEAMIVRQKKDWFIGRAGGRKGREANVVIIF